MRSNLEKIIKSIQPWDLLEIQHFNDAVAWLGSRAEIYRIKKPDIPPKHLVSYSLVIDPHLLKILLVEHKLSRWD